MAVGLHRGSWSMELRAWFEVIGWWGCVAREEGRCAGGGYTNGRMGGWMERIDEGVFTGIMR